MNQDDNWILFDGPEPDRLLPILDALRDAPPSTPAIQARAVHVVMQRLEAILGEEDGTGEDEEAEASTQPKPPAPATPAPAASTPGEAGPTVRSPSAGDRPDAPLAADPVPPPPAAPPPAPAALSPSIARLASTEPYELPAHLRAVAGKLPFQAPSAVKAAPRTMPVRMMKDPKLGETRPMEGSLARAVAALPFLDNTMSSGVVPFPRLTVAQYASLCAELVAPPEDADRILPVYHVFSKPSHAALDADWTEVFAAQPEMRVAFLRLAKEFAPHAREVRR